MAKNRRRTKKRARISVAMAGAVSGEVPTRWVKFVVGIFLLPLAWVLTQTFFTAFARTTVRDAFWCTEEFWFFSLGAAIWVVAFFGLPKPLWIYVFGHELTHAIWVWMLGGKVHQFHVSRRGGHIIADKTNTWIALAPYFFPIYSLLVIALYGGLSLFFDLSEYHKLLYACVGLTWAFHLSFTCWMIPKGQTDLTYGGTFFSLTLIYLLNLLLLAGFLIVASPSITLRGFAKEFLQNASDFSVLVIRLIHKIHS